MACPTNFAAVALEEDGRGQWDLTSDFPVNGGAPLALEVYSGGNLVGEQVIFQASPFRMSSYLEGFRVPCWTIRIYLGFLVDPYFCLWDFHLSPFFFRGGKVTVEVEVEGQTFTGDRVGVRTIPGAEPGPDVAFTSEIVLLASGLDSFVLAEESTLSVDVFRDGFESGDLTVWQ